MRLILLILVLLNSMAPAEAGKKRRQRKKPQPLQAFKPRATPLLVNDSPELISFLKKLSSMNSSGKNGSIFILGDSHQQCEDFGYALISHLKDSASIPFSGRNYAFPYPFARTSQRSPMRFACTKSDWSGCRITKPALQCQWGICGWLAGSGADSLRFSWGIGDDHFEAGDEVGILSPSGAGGYRLWWEDSLCSTEIPYEEKKYGFYLKLPNSRKKLNFRLRKTENDATFLHQGFVRNPVKPGLQLGISGTNGARLDHYLLSPDLDKHLQIIRPGLLVIALGTNDAFLSPFDESLIRQNLGMLVSRIRMQLPDVAILLLGPPDHCQRRGKINRKTASVNKVFAEMAESLELGFWNLQEAMGGEKSAFAWRRKKLLTTDFVHFTMDGYRLQGKLLGSAIISAMHQIVSCK